jgi:VCBS repeat protein/FG-GAP repeat protein
MANADFDGDGRSEIPVSSPWGIGILELSGSTLASPVMAANGTRFGGWLLNTGDNKLEVTGDFDGDGRHEILIASPWGIAVLKQSGGALRQVMIAPNGTRFGGWLLNTADNRFGPVGDFDGDGRSEILVTSPWGIGILKLAGTTFTVPRMAQNGTRFGGWLLNTADNRFGPVGDMDGDRRDELLVTSPWGLGLLELSGSTLAAVTMAPNGTRFGGWLLNTADNHANALADYDGDGRAELLITSPWGMGVLKLAGGGLTSLAMAANGTRIGGWLLNTLDNRLGPVADYDGDGRTEVLIASPWGIGILELSGGASFAVPMMAPNGTRFGGWLLNTADNRFDMAGDFNGDGRVEILVTSPWGIGILRLSGSALTQVMIAANGSRFGGWLLNTADNRFGIGMEVLRLHVKILTTPSVSIEQMLVSMQQVYEAIGIRVHRVSTENLTLAALNDLDVGACSGAVTAEQTQLFGNRNNAPNTDVVVYFVRSTVPPLNGCASFPAGRPGAVVTQVASRWTLGHEVGHVLGLPHCDTPAARLFNRLMTGGGTANITNPPPDLIVQEVNTMKASRLTHVI